MKTFSIESDSDISFNRPMKFREKAKAVWKEFELWWILLGVIATIVGAIFGATTYIKVTAENAVLDERFLAKLSARVRPSCIVTSKGTIEADLGAMEYLNDVRVILKPEAYGFEVVISPKRHLVYPPQVTALNVNVTTHIAERIKLNDWSVLLVPQSTQQPIISAQEMNTNRVYRFLIEILH